MRQLFIRVSDNVLSSDLWTTGKLKAADGFITHSEVLHDGVYGLPYCIGWDVSQLAEWLEHDSDTPQYPETYCEISIDNKEWFSNLSTNELDNFLGGVSDAG